MSTPTVAAFFDPVTATISYVVSDPVTNEAAIIDPVLDYEPESGRTTTVNADRIARHVEEWGLKAVWLLETHAHADHLSAAPYLKQLFGGRTAIGEHVTQVQTTFGKIYNLGADFAIDGRQFDHLFTDGERFEIGRMGGRVIHTPGHTPACVTYVIGDAAFVGDTLFMPDYGTARTDFPGGDARTLYRSIHRLYDDLAADTRVFLCHDYPPPERTHAVWETTLAAERSGNVHIHDGVSEEQFAALRTARDRALKVPTLLLPSVQVNIRAGHFPPPEDNGVSYLKIPLNRI